MKKLLITTVLMLSTYSLVGADIGRYEYTERLATCQKLKSIADGMSADGVAESDAGMSSFIANCLGTTFDDLNVVAIPRQVFCPDEIRTKGSCKFRLESSPVGSAVQARSISSGFKGIAKFTCGASGSWSDNNVSTCIQEANKCTEGTVTWGSGGVNCFTVVPSIKEGSTIRIKNNGKLNPAVKGYANVSCSGGVLSTSGGSCGNYTCRIGQSFIWSNESVAVVNAVIPALNTNSVSMGSLNTIGYPDPRDAGASSPTQSVDPEPVTAPDQVNNADTTTRVKNIPKCRGFVESVDGISGTVSYEKLDSRYFDTEEQVTQQSRIFDGEVNVVCSRGAWVATTGHCTRYSDPDVDLDCDLHKIKMGNVEQREVYKCSKR